MSQFKWFEPQPVKIVCIKYTMESKSSEKYSQVCTFRIINKLSKQ